MSGRPGAIERRALPALARHACLAAATLMLLPVPAARAQQASGYAELTAGRSDSQNEDATGQRSDSQNDLFLQRYSLDLQWRLYPNFSILAGGLFERDAATTTIDGMESASTRRRIRPYLTAALRAAIYSAQFGYYRTEDDVSSGGLSSGNVQEVYNTSLGWRPDQFPSLTFRYLRTNTFDPDRRALDTIDDSFDVVSEYQPVDTLQVYYRGALQNFEDRIEDNTVRRTSHAGRLTYGDTFWNRRVQVGAEYDINHRTTEITAGGGGDIVSMLFPIAGLAVISDMPADVVLLPAPALIDNDRTVPSGINIGLPPPAGDDRPRNLGLDFGIAATANTLFVWIDRQLPQNIAATFTWDIYTSADNITWTLQQTAAPATFGPFQPRFEISFAEVSARYIKVVTRPLSVTVPSADQFPDIPITELTAALRTPAADVEGRSSQTSQFFSSSVQTRILDTPSLYHELSYFVRQVGDAPSTSTLSNGLSLRHAFNEVYSTAARVAREDSRESEGDRTTYQYSASLRAVPLRTLQSSMVFSGRSSDIDGRTSRSSSLFLYSTAELYRGINANLSLGTSTATAEEGDQTDRTQVNAVATLVPHPTTTFNLIYQNISARHHGGMLLEDQDLGMRSRQASLSYRPVATLYMYASYRMESQAGHDDRFLRNYSVSWAPFPDGSLQVQIRFDESYQSELQSLSRTWSPRVRWNITDRFYVELAYEQAKYDSELVSRMIDSLTANMRIYF